MPPYRAIKWRELVYYLKKLGFKGPYPGSKHQYSSPKWVVIFPSPPLLAGEGLGVRSSSQMI